MLFETYLHGFQYFTCARGTRRFNVLRSSYFGVIILLATSFFLYQTYSNIAAYLLFNVATSISYQHLAYGSKQSSIDFPAITICNNNAFLADIAGYGVGSGGSSAAIAVAEGRQQPINVSFKNLTDVSALVQMATLTEEALQICNSTLSQPPQWLSNLCMFGGLENLGVAYTARQASPNSVKSVVACRWQGKAINCSDLFLNRMTDMGPCFTFYPSVDMVNSYTLLSTALTEAVDEVAKNNQTWTCAGPSYLNQAIPAGCETYENVSAEAFQMNAFGTTSEQIQRYNLSTSSVGVSSGLQLFMNVLPTQYCAARQGSQNTYGFVAFVHDRDVPPILELESGVEIAPGFAVNIAIDITKIDRTATQAIGKCGSVFLQWYSPNIPYSKDACMTQCFAQLVYDVCGCIPYTAPPMLFSTPLARSKPCVTNPQAQCFGTLVYGGDYGKLNVTSIPPVCASKTSYMSPGCLFQTCKVGGIACPYACTETQYTTQASASPLRSPRSYQAALGQTFTTAMDLMEFRKTFVVANFFYNTLDITVITETQKIQIMDVVNGVGGSMGLCLGGSFLVVGEILLNAIAPLLARAFCKAKRR